MLGSQLCCPCNKNVLMSSVLISRDHCTCICMSGTALAAVQVKVASDRTLGCRVCCADLSRDMHLQLHENVLMLSVNDGKQAAVCLLCIWMPSSTSSACTELQLARSVICMKASLCLAHKVSTAVVQTTPASIDGCPDDLPELSLGAVSSRDCRPSCSN